MRGGPPWRRDGKSWFEQSLPELLHDKKANAEWMLALYLEEELLHIIQPQSFLRNLHKNGVQQTWHPACQLPSPQDSTVVEPEASTCDWWIWPNLWPSWWGDSSLTWKVWRSTGWQRWVMAGAAAQLVRGWEFLVFPHPEGMVDHLHAGPLAHRGLVWTRRMPRATMEPRGQLCWGSAMGWRLWGANPEGSKMAAAIHTRSQWELVAQHLSTKTKLWEVSGFHFLERAG